MSTHTEAVQVAERPGITAHLDDQHILIFTNAQAEWTIEDWAIVAMATMGMRWNTYPVRHLQHDSGDECWIFCLPVNNPSHYVTGGEDDYAH
jgi:hypothetical protein